MIVLFRRSLAPYRVSPFNSQRETVDSAFTLVLTCFDPPPDRQWAAVWRAPRRGVTLNGWVESSRSIGEPPPQGSASCIEEPSPGKGSGLLLGAAPQILRLFPRAIVADDGPLSFAEPTRSVSSRGGRVA